MCGDQKGNGSKSDMCGSRSRRLQRVYKF